MRMRKVFAHLIVFMLCFNTIITAQTGDRKMERLEMIRDQIQARGVEDKRVLEAMLKVERHLFVPENMERFAYDDTPLPIGYDQTISQPYIVAYMTEQLRLKPDDRVLEIGTGSGYQAAVLAELVKEVYTVEIVKPLAREAEERFKKLGYKNVFVKHGDGYKGWPDKAPFDAVMITAAPREIPGELIDQMATGGRMIVPVGVLFQELYLITRQKSGYTTKELMSVRFVPMVKGK
jgi:protein-L-isoaspartate(D-aspartate) O-methyltransferase